MKKYFSYLLLCSFIVFAIIACKKEGTITTMDENTEIDPNFNPTPYILEIPPFFPQVMIPQDNPLTVEGVELGRHLFWEKKLSGDNTMSCGTCHVPENSFSDPNQFSTGITGEMGNRQAMACVNLAWSKDFFWDGRAPQLEDQVVGPVANPIEMNQDWDEAVLELADTDLYPPMFLAAFGNEEITKEKCGKAMASFVRTMVAGNSKVDRQRIGLYTFTESEQRGFELFLKEPDYDAEPENAGGGDCFHCHVTSLLQFSDYQFHNNGLDETFSDLGLGGVTGLATDEGKFKTPTLKNIELTAPYMHDGRFATLEEVVEHYNSGTHESATLDPLMKYTEFGLMLTDQDKIDLIAFLKCMTDTEFTTNPAFQDPHE